MKNKNQLWLWGIFTASALVCVLATTSAYAQNIIVDRFFIIMLENHTQSKVIGNPNAPHINALARKYAMAMKYYGVTHPSMPNYIAATSGSNWSINNDDSAHTIIDHRNVIDQLETHHIPWAAYMDAMPNAGYLGDHYPEAKGNLKEGDVKLYVAKHNPFVLYKDIRENPARLANIKPYSSLAEDLNGRYPPAYVWISPDQCHDMHGGLNKALTGYAETPCPFGDAKNGDANDAALQKKADEFVDRTVTTIMTSRAWTAHSVIFITIDENDFVRGNKDTNNWESAEACCDSPVLRKGYKFKDNNGKETGGIWKGTKLPNGKIDYRYGGGLVPMVVIAPAGPKNGFTSNTEYNHYSLLRTIEEVWNLGYLENASHENNVHSMTEFLHR